MGITIRIESLGLMDIEYDDEKNEIDGLLCRRHRGWDIQFRAHQPCPGSEIDSANESCELFN